MTEENQNQENVTTEENPVSAEPKQEVVENVPVVDNPTDSQNIADQTQNDAEVKEQVEIPAEPIIEPVIETPGIETTETIEQTENKETGSLHSVREDEVVEEVPQIEEIQSQPVKQEQPQTQTVEKIIYQTPPNLIQNLLIKARAKIQERKNKKLDKIMSLFESNPNISNSDVQELLRTTKRSATRYLNILEKEQKIIQVGNAGRGVRYVRKI